MGNEIVNKEKDLKGFIIGILVIIVAGLVGFIVYDKIFSNIKNDIKSENAVENNNQEINLTISDSRVQFILRSFDIIMNGGYRYLQYHDTQNKLIYTENDSFWPYAVNDVLFSNLKIDEENKNIIALGSAKEVPVDEKNKNSKVYTKLLNENKEYEDHIMQISGSEVENIYKMLFGTNIAHKDNGMCPNYIYDKENNVYYDVYGCGGDSGGNILIYRYDFVEKNNGVISFKIALAYSEKNDYTKNEYDVYDFYGAINPNVIIKKHEGPFSINDSNKNKFTNYKVTFKNIEGNYVFDKIEKISA